MRSLTSTQVRGRHVPRARFFHKRKFILFIVKERSHLTLSWCSFHFISSLCMVAPQIQVYLFFEILLICMLNVGADPGFWEKHFILHSFYCPFHARSFLTHLFAIGNATVLGGYGSSGPPQDPPLAKYNLQCTLNNDVYNIK